MLDFKRICIWYRVVYMQEIAKPKIVVLGVGGAGCNTVSNLAMSSIAREEVTFIAANTDQQALNQCSPGTVKIAIGGRITKGLGAGADPAKGAEAARESRDEILKIIADADMLFITAGAGGGTGSGAAPEIAKFAREKDILTVGFVTSPFDFEGVKRRQIAEVAISELQHQVDCLLVIHNQNLITTSSKNLTIKEAFAQVDKILYDGVRGIVNTITKTGLINTDFQDVKRVMKGRMSTVIFGVGRASGENAGIKAMEMALSNPLLDIDEHALKQIDTLLVSVTGGKDLTLNTVEEMLQHAREKIDSKADNIILGLDKVEDTDSPTDMQHSTDTVLNAKEALYQNQITNCNAKIDELYNDIASITTDSTLDRVDRTNQLNSKTQEIRKLQDEIEHTTAAISRLYATSTTSKASLAPDEIEVYIFGTAPNAKEIHSIDPFSLHADINKSRLDELIGNEELIGVSHTDLQQKSEAWNQSSSKTTQGQDSFKSVENLKDKKKSWW